MHPESEIQGLILAIISQSLIPVSTTLVARRGSFVQKNVSTQNLRSVDDDLERVDEDAQSHHMHTFRLSCSHDWTLPKLERLEVNSSSRNKLIRPDYFCVISRDEIKIVIPRSSSYQS
ncbi:hypothetical protein FPOAC2_06978 [Fusarium poae]|jgi:hypothetical protein